MKKYRSKMVKWVDGHEYEAIVPLIPHDFTYIFVDGDLVQVLDKASLEEADRVARDVIKTAVLSE